MSQRIRITHKLHKYFYVNSTWNETEKKNNNYELSWIRFSFNTYWRLLLIHFESVFAELYQLHMDFVQLLRN